MRILAIYRHFWPDSPPYAAMLRTITAHLAAEGHDVHVLAEQPCYKTTDRALSRPARERVDGVSVRRLGRLPGQNLALFGRLALLLFPARVVLAALLARLRGERYDLVWTATIPPGINGLAGRIAARLLGAKFLYHFQDIYPELQTNAGNWKKGGFLDRLVGAIDNGNANAAQAMIVLSGDMADTVAARGIERTKISIINNFMIDEFDGHATPEIPTNLQKSAGFTAIFAGNVGRFQGLEAVVEAARTLATTAPEVEIFILGDGAAKASLQAQAKDLPNVRFHGHLPFESAQEVIAQADLGLVSVDAGIFRTAYPSKTLTYLGLGVPVLAVIEPQSELARTLTEQGLGYVAQGREPADIADAIEQAASNRPQTHAMRDRAREYYAAHLSKDAVLAQWSALIAQMGRL